MQVALESQVTTLDYDCERLNDLHVQEALEPSGEPQASFTKEPIMSSATTRNAIVTFAFHLNYTMSLEAPGLVYLISFAHSSPSA